MIIAGRGGALKVLETSFRNYLITHRHARAAGTALTVPRVADLLARPDFEPLKLWLRERNVDLDDLQAAVDEILDQARQAAEAD